MSNINEIGNSGRHKLPEEKLMAYLNGTLSPEEQHEVERLLSEESMESDAIEGLKQLPPQNAVQSVEKLNRQLRRLTHKRKRRSRAFVENKWAWLALLLILLLGVIGYWVLYLAAR